MQNPKFETVHTFKTVDRLPMTDHQYLVWWSEHSSEHRCADLSTAGVDMTSERQGYLVRYQTGTDQEYYSWSPKEILDAATVPPMKTIEIELNPDDPDVINTIQRISEMAYEQFHSKFRMERCEESDVSSTSLAEPKYSPLFEKVQTAFLEKLKVTSLPQALEAALVVYTDGLTYSEE